MKQLYTVEVVRELIVLADSVEEAGKLAQKAADHSVPGYHVREMYYYPDDWDDDCIPFGDYDEESPDRTVGKWSEMGAAPKLRK